MFGFPHVNIPAAAKSQLWISFSESVSIVTAHVVVEAQAILKSVAVAAAWKYIV